VPPGCLLSHVVFFSGGEVHLGFFVLFFPPRLTSGLPSLGATWYRRHVSPFFFPPRCLAAWVAFFS